MKILKEGNLQKDESPTSIQVCGNCGSCLEISDNEWAKDFEYDEFVNCPYCNSEVYRDYRNTIPALEYPLADKVVNNTDFEKIHKAMGALNWRWAGYETIPPTINELKERAKDLLIEALKRKTSIGTGGFWVEYLAPDEYGNEGVILSFQVDRCGVYKDNSGNIQFI